MGRLSPPRPIIDPLTAQMLGKLADALESAWSPLPGRQSQAYYSAADVLLYGGAAGGGKSDLLLGLCHTAHQRSIVFRREYPQLQALEDRSREMFGDRGDYNATKRIWKLRDSRQIEFGAVALPGDEQNFQGRAHDLAGFDEITHFSETQFRFLCGWLRSTKKGQRCRVVCTGNPPVDAAGDWVIRYWSPWLDEKHPHPAQAGELRWFAVIDGKETEVPDGRPFEHAGETITPQSRTFIPARIADNPYLANSGYKSQLQALPEPLRSMMLEGNFGIVQEDNPWQVIPTAWIRAAQARWTPQRPTVTMTALGVDVARGGKDKTCLTMRYANWFSETVSVPGTSTPDGRSVVRLILEHRQDEAAVNIDVIGCGTSPTDIAEMNGINVTPMNGSAGSDAKDKSGQLGFVNKRAEWHWRLREALDPESGEDMAIPPDRELLADLCAPRWKLMARGIQIESKDEIKMRIGRSPDKGESVLYAHAGAGGAQGWVDYYKRMALRGQGETPPTLRPDRRPTGIGFMRPRKEAPAKPTVTMRALVANANCCLSDGARYSSDGDRFIRNVLPEHIEDLKAMGCVVVEG
jgi:hypothetical protein